MNKIIYKIFPILTLVFALAMTSCLSDSAYDNNEIGINPTNNTNYVEVHITSNDNSNIIARAYPTIGRDTTITQFMAVNLTSGPATSDLTISYVQMGTDKLSKATYSYVVDSLVNINGFLLADASKITDLNNGSVTIPKGSSTGYIKVKLNPNNLIGSTYVFAIRITAVSDKKYTISNLTDGVAKFGAANMYDGQYINTGTMTDYANANFTGAYPLTVNLVTQSANSVGYFDVKIWGDYFHAMMNGTSYSGYGSFAPVFTFDASNNVTSVINIYGQPAGNGRSAELDPSGINKFDPATKTLSVSYWMNQPAVYSPHRVHFVEVFTYVGPR